MFGRGKCTVRCLAALPGDSYCLHRLHVGLHGNVYAAVLALLVGSATKRCLLLPRKLDAAEVDLPLHVRHDLGALGVVLLDAHEEVVHVQAHDPDDRALRVALDEGRGLEAQAFPSKLHEFLA